MYNMLKYNGILIVGLMLLSSVTWSQKTVYSTMTQINCVLHGEELVVYDNRSDEPVGATGAENYKASYSAVARLRYTRESMTDLVGKTWAYRVTYNIVNAVSDILIDGPHDLQIQLGTGIDNIYLDENLHPIPDLLNDPQIKLVVTKVEASSDGQIYCEGILDVMGIVPRDVYLELDIETDRYDRLIEENISIKNNNLNPNEDIVVSWKHIEGAELYELEWLFWDEDNIGSPDADDWKDAVSIQTQDQTYTISNFYPTGKIYLRTRPIGRYIIDVDPKDNLLLQGGWWYVQPAEVASVDNINPDKNWQFQTSYAEDGKYKKVISFFDDGLKNRQTTTNLSTEETPLRATTHYDHEGRPVVNVLPAPDNANPSLGYVDFNMYDRTKFDRIDDPDPMSNTGANVYYSSANSSDGMHKEYIPDAEDYPFTQSKYLPDGTGRMTAQSGVGAPYSIGSGHETRYFYDDPSEMQLKRLFGKNVGEAKYYKRNLVQDANGQFSVSYVDAAGQTIATALVGKSPENVLALDSEDEGTVQIIENLMDNNVLTNTDNSSVAVSTIMNEFPGTNLTLNYDLTVLSESLAVEDGQLCMGCGVEILFKVYDPCGTLMDTASYHGLVDDMCGASLEENGKFDFTVTMDLVGLYAISKELKIIPRTAQEWHDALDIVDMLPEYTYFYDLYLAEIDTSECTLDCGTYCIEVVQAMGLTEESPGYQDALNTCVFDECGDDLLIEGSLLQCDAILARIIEQIQSDACFASEWKGNEAAVASLTFNLDGEDGVSGDLVYPYLIQPGYQWQVGWADTLAKLHPEYDCTYLNCRSLADSRYFDYKLPMFDRWDEVSSGSHTNITGDDPFFTSAGFGTISDMTTYLETYSTDDDGHPLDGIDPATPGCENGTADIVNFINCLFADSTSAFKWSFYAAAYAFQKSKLLIQQEGDLCGDEGVCTVRQMLPDLLDFNDVDDALVWTENGIEESCADFCAGQSEYILNQIRTGGCNDGVNFEELRNLLNVHCIDNCDFSNPFGYFTQEQRILPSYIAIENWLSSNGCSAEIFTEELTYYWDSVYVEGGRFKDAGISVMDTLCQSDSLDMYFFQDSLYRNSLGLPPMVDDTEAFLIDTGLYYFLGYSETCDTSSLGTGIFSWYDQTGIWLPGSQMGTRPQVYNFQDSGCYYFRLFTCSPIGPCNDSSDVTIYVPGCDNNPMIVIEELSECTIQAHIDLTMVQSPIDTIRFTVRVDGGAPQEYIENEILTEGDRYDFEAIVDYSNCCEPDTISNLWGMGCTTSLNLTHSDVTNIISSFVNNCTGTRTNKWFKDNIILPGETGTSVNCTTYGYGEYRLDLTCGCCFVSKSIVCLPLCSVSISQSGTELIANVSNCASTPTYIWELRSINTGWFYDGDEDTYETFGGSQSEPLIYRVTIECGGCIASDMVTLTPDCSVSISQSGSLLTANESNCDGAPSYNWERQNGSDWDPLGSSNSYNATVPGTYRVTVECGGCIDSDQITIAPTCIGSVTVDASGCNFTSSISGIPGPTYTWQRYGEGSWVSAGGSGSTFTGLDNQLYRLKVIGSDGCVYYSLTVFGNCTSVPCDCDATLTLAPNCILNLSGSGASCGNWQLQFSETGSGWISKLNGSGAVDPTYSVDENGLYRLIISTSSECRENEVSDPVMVDCFDIICDDSYNLIPVGVDGTFEALIDTASTGDELFNNYVGEDDAPGWKTLNGTPDSWLSPITTSDGSHGFRGLADGMPPSNQGGVFVCAGKFSMGESFGTTINTTIGSTYIIKFEQANAGVAEQTTAIMSNWLVRFGNVWQDAPFMNYLGEGNQEWEEQSLTFTATSTSSVLEFKCSSDPLTTDQEYMAVDNIRVYLDDGTNPCLITIPN